LPLLDFLDFSDNRIKNIDVSNNVNLDRLSARRNFLTNLDISVNVNLTSLNVAENDLSDIDLSTNILLEDLYISTNYLKEISLVSNEVLQDIDLSTNQLTNLDLTSNLNLVDVNVFGNRLTAFNIKNGNNTNITNFDARSNNELYCILVDDAAYSTSNWTNVNAQVMFNETSCDFIELSPKVLLQGASLNPNVGEESLMRDDLRINGLISQLSPYGDGATASTVIRFNDNGGNSAVDWVWVELRDRNDPTNVITGQSGILQRDGDIVAPTDDLSTPLFFEGLSVEKYHIVVKHRNHLSVMTATSETLKQQTTIVDFTDATNEITYGINAQTSVGMQANKMAMWAGDVNGDTTIQYSGTNPDTPAILSTVLNDPGNFLNFPTYSINAYMPDDLNMDGIIQYSGTNPDTPVILQNVLGHPGNFLNFSTFRITEQLPEND
jgi:alpha-glucosidase (family GH31 glycosyl hydrolase)